MHSHPFVVLRRLRSALFLASPKVGGISRSQPLYFMRQQNLEKPPSINQSQHGCASDRGWDENLGKPRRGLFDSSPARAPAYSGKVGRMHISTKTSYISLRLGRSTTWPFHNMARRGEVQRVCSEC